MGLLLGIVMIVLGLLAASSFIVARKPGAGGLIDILRPVQGILGVLGCVLGCFVIVNFLFSMGGKQHPGIVIMFRDLGGAAVLAATGFLMGFGMITNMLASDREAQEKADELYQTLELYKIPLGLGSMGFGVWIIMGSLG